MTSPSPEFDISKLIDYYQNSAPGSSIQTTPDKAPGKKYVRERTPSPAAAVGNKTSSPPVSPQEDTAESNTMISASSTQPTPTRTVESPPERPVPVLSRPPVTPVTPSDTYKVTVLLDLTLPIETYYKNHWVEVMGFARLYLNPKDVLTTSPTSPFSQPLQVFHMRDSWPILERKPIRPLPPNIAARLAPSEFSDEADSPISPLPRVTIPNSLDLTVRAPTPVIRNHVELGREVILHPSADRRRSRARERERNRQRIEEWQADIPQPPPPRTANTERML
ncbi:hypothetical protein PtrSN002B_005820 [Pyrenophora tritici-repentis]|nr:hypothetical protein A1F99_130580 [Pyrenophora tritici-repentis]KAI0610126.1 hypothetical protein TUN205_05633 [Pyrenophora tritici-repentis]KAI0622087.1 hypothetical protein TUN199_05927 [Pyrenophora tritici-repentis]KAI1538540.1 hypothetical protein PtrSN001C_005665 [Pyrenophora tritici-repentis]KAI1550875.1 hypothetical protein PtrSN002B_005820 [Pyrenophora tritici-repentis]